MPTMFYGFDSLVGLVVALGAQILDSHAAIKLSLDLQPCLS